MEHAWQGLLTEKDRLLTEKDRVLNSTERMKVLADLELALNLIQAYQRALILVSASDPNIIKADALLEKWNLKGEANATYLGFRKNSSALDPILEREEKDWEYGAYGSGNVSITAEAIDEGGDKEPGYTRARVNVAVAEPEPLTEDKSAGWSSLDDNLAAP